MSEKPPRCPRAGCGRFLQRKGARWWCPRCAKWISDKNAR